MLDGPSALCCTGLTQIASNNLLCTWGKTGTNAVNRHEASQALSPPLWTAAVRSAAHKNTHPWLLLASCAATTHSAAACCLPDPSSSTFSMLQFIPSPSAGLCCCRLGLGLNACMQQNQPAVFHFASNSRNTVLLLARNASQKPVLLLSAPDRQSCWQVCEQGKHPTFPETVLEAAGHVLEVAHAPCAGRLSAHRLLAPVVCRYTAQCQSTSE